MKDQSAFPTSPGELTHGITKYEYFFAAALTGVCAGTIKYRPDEAVKTASALANAAIKHLEENA